MKQDPSRGGASSPVYDTVRRGLAESMFDTAKQAVRDEQQRRRSQALRTGFAPAPAEEPKKENPWLSALKTLGGAVISIPATGADIVAKPFEAIPGFPDVNPEDVGSFNFFVQGGKSLQHAYGDAKELTRSIITGKDTLSQSPTAQAYQAAGGGLTGTLAAAGPYLDLGSVVAPMAMGAARGAGLVAPKPVPYKPLTASQVDAPRTRTAFDDYLEMTPTGRDSGTVVFGGKDRPSSPVEKLASAQTNLEIAKAAQRQAREAIGIEVQDIDFPSPLGATDLLRVDATDYGVFRTDGSAWEDLGSQQISAGINVENLPNEMASMRQYFSNDYENFQDYLRGHTANDQVRAHVQNIDRVFAATPPTTRKFKVFRGVRSGSGSPDSEYVGAFYRSLQPGQLIVEPAYLSTSISQGFASEWASANMDDILLVIDVPEGSVAINPITSWKRGLDEIDDHLYAPEEQELLFNRGTVLRVTQNDGNVIRAEIVPAHEVSTSPLSTSDIKQSLLERYSYKQLAEMVQEGEQKYQFYEAFLKDDEELQKMVSKLRWPESGIKDVARMIADLRLDAFDDVGDYEAFRDAAFLFEDDDGMLAAGKKLLTFLKKRQLLEPEMLTFIKNNLEEIIDY